MKKMEHNVSIILNVNLRNNNCEGRKWTQTLLEYKKAFYGCRPKISTKKLFHGMKAFIKLNGGELEHGGKKYKDIQIVCRVINPETRESSKDPIELKLEKLFDENDRITNYHLQSLGVDSLGHRGHRYIDEKLH